MLVSATGPSVAGGGGLLAANNLSDLANKQTAVDNLTNDAAVLHVKLANTATEGIQLYNTADQTTNYERLSINWTANQAFISAQQAGTGAGRTLNFTTTGNQIVLAVAGSTSGMIRHIGTSTSQAGNIIFGIGGTTSTATSGTNVGISLTLTYNQASGNAANTDLLVNRTQTLVGSGQQNLIDLQVGGTSKFRVDNTGVVVGPAGFQILGVLAGGAGTSLNFANGNTMNGAAGIAQIGASFTYTINQTSTASFTDLLVNRTQTAAGSGAQLLLDLQVSTVSKFSVSNTGAINVLGPMALNAQNITGAAAILSASSVSGIGYQTGAGGTVTQATSKVTAFSLSKVVGTIQFAADALGADTTSAGAVWTNTAIAATDIVLWNHISGGTLGAYQFSFACGAGSATVKIRNMSPGSLSEAPVIAFAVMKGVTS